MRTVFLFLCLFIFTGATHVPCTIHRVVDGDTVDLTVHFPYGLSLRSKARLLGLDTWELKGEEKILGIKAKNALKRLAKGKESTVLIPDDAKRDNFGRLLLYLRLDEIKVENWMERNGHTKEP